MRRLVILLAVLCLAVLVQAETEIIEHIQIYQGAGSKAEFDKPDLAWSGGSYAYAVTDLGTWLSFERADIDAQFNLSTDDTPVGGPAKARFDLVTNWTVDLYEYEDDLSPVVTITGNLNSGGGFGGKYWEERTDFGQLNGKTWVNILNVDVNPDWLDATLGGNGLDWDEDLIAGLDSDVTLNGGTDISDYQGSYLSSNGLTVTLFSDQDQVVPEPATMLLLGLGAVLLCKKK